MGANSYLLTLLLIYALLVLLPHASTTHYMVKASSEVDSQPPVEKNSPFTFSNTLRVAAIMHRRRAPPPPPPQPNRPIHFSPPPPPTPPPPPQSPYSS
ncbi:uncharacterized protein LOC21407262 [Morus notabilis]|nr:uncharacterized protein LOC21407262 [Morus notabilis]